MFLFWNCCWNGNQKVSTQQTHLETQVREKKRKCFLLLLLLSFLFFSLLLHESKTIVLKERKTRFFSKLSNFFFPSKLSALHFASDRVFQLLLTAGADVSIQNSAGLRPNQESPSAINNSAPAKEKEKEKAAVGSTAAKAESASSSGTVTEEQRNTFCLFLSATQHLIVVLLFLSLFLFFFSSLFSLFLSFSLSSHFCPLFLSFFLSYLLFFSAPTIERQKRFFCDFSISARRRSSPIGCGTPTREARRCKVCCTITNRSHW